MISTNGLRGWDLGLPKKDAAAIFKKRHKAALWHGVIPAFIFVSLGIASIKIEALRPYDWYVTGIQFFAFMWGYIFMMLCYRCPRCGRIPYSAVGFWVFPKYCANNECHAPLLTEHPWAH